MTDQELIELVESSTPDELTLDQLMELKARMKHSAQLREALRSQLRFHQAMCRTYSSFSASLGAILGQAVAPAAASPLSALYGWGLGGFAVMMVASVTVLQLATTAPHAIQASPKEAEVVAEPNAPADPKVGERYVEMSRPAREVPAEDLSGIDLEDMPMPSPSDHPPVSPIARPAPSPMPPLCTSPSEDFPDPRDGAPSSTDGDDPAGESDETSDSEPAMSVPLELPLPQVPVLKKPVLESPAMVKPSSTSK